MNETDIQKALVKAAFNMKHFPNCGLQDHHQQKSQLVRQYILDVSGYTKELSPTTQSPYGPKSKKYAMISLYKLWSAFSKGLKHNASLKHKPILIPQIGVWSEVKVDKAYDE